MAKCTVCEGPPSGMHYGAVTCEGCKAFFRRMSREKIVYTCLSDNCCTIDRTVSRSCCKACRFQKCLHVGMELPGFKRRPVKRPRGISTNSGTQTCQALSVKMLKTERRDTTFSDELEEAFRELEREECQREPTLVDLMSDYTDVLHKNRIRKILTADAVALAVKAAFGDQLLLWKLFMDSALARNERPFQPETTLDTMIQAVHWHNRDSRKRAFRFITRLPGIDEVDMVTSRTLVIGWKWLSFWLLHQSAFVAGPESYMVIEDKNGQRFHYCRYWQDFMSEPRLNGMVLDFCNGLNEIGLTELEKYILVAIVLFEPDTGSKPSIVESDKALHLLHRHYTDVLLDVLKHRCSDKTELSRTCQKLAKFFGTLKLVYEMYTNLICGRFMSLVNRQITP